MTDPVPNPAALEERVARLAAVVNKSMALSRDSTTRLLTPPLPPSTATFPGSPDTKQRPPS